MNRGNMGRLPSAVGDMLCFVRATNTATDTHRAAQEVLGCMGFDLRVRRDWNSDNKDVVFLSEEPPEASVIASHV